MWKSYHQLAVHKKSLTNLQTSKYVMISAFHGHFKLSTDLSWKMGEHVDKFCQLFANTARPIKQRKKAA